MRKYIDQEAAQKIVCSTCEVCRNPTLETLMGCEICPGFAKIPAEDVLPVVHGKWEYAYWCEFKCSNCGAWSKSEPYRGRENFCPNCGARMDLEG